uniref:Peptidase S8/S53 domain-containing protein n=1 Tax=Kalanchoe fedtschenkoi TaxID=63787 RepID=A0A7N0U6X5_KALFE
MGFHEDVKRSAEEDELIIGVLDDGIWPESESFSDEGLGPPPKRWKGICQTNSFGFKCNNKIIGARFYVPDPALFNLTSDDEVSPRETYPHGSHVASTIAGVPVRGVSVGGLKNGTARGAVPRARIAVYKVCWGNYWRSWCHSILQAMDDALSDGVDIMSLSIGNGRSYDYGLEEISAVAFSAMRRGVLVSVSAGNDGPQEFTVGHASPWLLTVANSFTAGSEFVTYVTLGNGERLKGEMMNLKDSDTQYPLALGWKVTNDTNKTTANMCNPVHLIQELVQGKILLCHDVSTMNFDTTGVAGVIFDYENAIGFAKTYYSYTHYEKPVVVVSGEDFAYLVDYTNNSSDRYISLVSSALYLCV